MNATMNVPMTNLKCQHGISVAQTAWTYENMGYTAAAMNMYQQAVTTLSAGISTLEGLVPDDALFHLGASQLRIGFLNQRQGHPSASRQWIQEALPNLQEAWRRFPGNPWYQQALVQASILLGQLGNAQEVRETSPKSAANERIGGWIDQALKVWDRVNGKAQRPVSSSGVQPNNDWSGVVMNDVFNGAPVWAGNVE